MLRTGASTASFSFSSSLPLSSFFLAEILLSSTVNGKCLFGAFFFAIVVDDVRQQPLLSAGSARPGCKDLATPRPQVPRH